MSHPSEMLGRPWDVQAWSSGEGPAGGRHLGDVPANLVLSHDPRDYPGRAADRQGKRGQDRVLGQVQVNREKEARGKVGSQEKGVFGDGGSDWLGPLLLASGPRVTFGVSNMVISPDLGKGCLGRGAGA